MEFVERLIAPQDVPQEVAAGQVGAVRLAARSILAVAVRKVAAENGHLPASEKQTLSALSDALSLAEAGADAGLPLTKTRPIPIPKGMGKKLTGNRDRRDAI